MKFKKFARSVLALSLALSMFYGVVPQAGASVGSEETTPREESSTDTSTVVDSLETPSQFSVTSTTYNALTAVWNTVQGATYYDLALNDQVLRTDKVGYTLTGLPSLTVYSVKVRAVNDSIASEWSYTLRAGTRAVDIKVPHMPDAETLGLNITDITDNSVTLEWNSIEGATDYMVLLGNKIMAYPKETEVTLEGLENSREYTLSLYGYNGKGVSVGHIETFATLDKVPVVPEVLPPVIVPTPTPSPTPAAPPFFAIIPPTITPEPVTDPVEEEPVVEEFVQEEIINVIIPMNTFTDIDTIWNHDQIIYLYDKGILKGTSATTFSPNSTITRMEFAILLSRVMGYSAEEYSGTFTDLSESAWYMDELGAVIEHGIVNGFDNNTLQPNAEITREQAAVMIANVLKGPDAGTSSLFKDDADISSWARESIYQVKSNGILTGLPDGTIAPSKVTTRAEAAAMIYNLMQVIG